MKDHATVVTVTFFPMPYRNRVPKSICKKRRKNIS